MGKFPRAAMRAASAGQERMMSGIAGADSSLAQCS